jgi:hypothetical protein
MDRTMPAASSSHSVWERTSSWRADPEMEETREAWIEKDSDMYSPDREADHCTERRIGAQNLTQTFAAGHGAPQRSGDVVPDAHFEKIRPRIRLLR